jgi:hypothetical protein
VIKAESTVALDDAEVQDFKATLRGALIRPGDKSWPSWPANARHCS